jgi:putative peptidoglycan lipid II flippase
VLVWLMASGLERFDSAVVMTRWMFPYIGFMSMVALSAGILNTWKRFAVPAATPVLLNLSVIGAAWLGAPLFQRQGSSRSTRWRRRDARRRAAAGGAGAGAAPRIGCCRTSGCAGRTAAAWQHPGVRRVLQADGAGAAGRVGGAGLAADQHADRLARGVPAPCPG